MANDRGCDLTISASVAGSNVADFPYFFGREAFPDEAVDPSGSNAARTDGGDLRTYQSSAEIPREVVGFEHDGSTGSGDAAIEVWTLVDIDAVTGATITIEYGDGALTDYASTDTYGRNAVWADYVGVWHMAQDPSGSAPQMVDSTGNGFDGTSSGSMVSGDLVPSVIGNGLNFNGTNQAIDLGGVMDVASYGDYLTVSAWANWDGSGIEQICSHHNTTSGEAIWQFRVNSGALEFIAWNTSATLAAASGATAFGTGNRYAAGVFNGSNCQVYLDGAADDASPPSLSGTIRAASTDEAFIARSETLDPGWWTGDIDEVRISALARSADWIATEYANQNDPETYISVGTPYAVGSGTTMAAAQGSYAVTGQAAGTARSHVMSAAAGSIALSGQPAVTAKGHALQAVAGSVAVTGYAAGTRWDHVMGAVAGSYVYTGQAANGAVGSSGAVIKSVFSDGGDGAATLTAAISAEPGEIIILAANSTDTDMFNSPSDDDTGTTGWNQVYDDSDVYATFAFGIAVWWKEASGDETSVSITAATGTEPQDAILMLGAVVAGLDPADPFDVAGYASSASGTGTSLAATLASATGQAASLLTFFAAYRQDIADGTESWTGAMATEGYVEFDNADPGDFDSSMWLGTENVASSAAHARTWSTSAAADEVYGVLLAWNVLPQGVTTMTAAAGGYDVTGQAADTRLKDIVMPAAVGDIVLTGNAAVTGKGHHLAAVAGGYDVTGFDAATAHILAELAAAQGQYDLTGFDAGLLRGRVMPAESGLYDLTGFAAGLVRSVITLSAGYGAYTLHGRAVTFERAELWDDAAEAGDAWGDASAAGGDWTDAVGNPTTWS